MIFIFLFNFVICNNNFFIIILILLTDFDSNNEYYFGLEGAHKVHTNCTSDRHARSNLHGQYSFQVLVPTACNWLQESSGDSNDCKGWKSPSLFEVLNKYGHNHRGDGRAGRVCYRMAFQTEEAVEAHEKMAFQTEEAVEARGKKIWYTGSSDIYRIPQRHRAKNIKYFSENPILCSKHSSM